MVGMLVAYNFSIPRIQALKLLFCRRWCLRQIGKTSTLILQIYLQLRNGDIRVVERADGNFNAISLVFIGQRRAAVFAKPALVGV